MGPQQSKTEPTTPQDCGLDLKFHFSESISQFFDLGFRRGLQTQLIFTYSNCLHRTQLQTLTNFFTLVSQTNSLSFNAMILDFRRKWWTFLALQTFAFTHINGVDIDSYALCSLLTASSDIKDVEFGKQLHTHVIKSGWLSSVFVGSALIDFYAKLLLINDAEEMFDKMPFRNSVCANALMYVKYGMWNEIEQFREEMKERGLEKDVGCSQIEVTS
ncbi:pentatricopeptide repeat-containing protein At3g24000, mitochondrial-like [Rhododendron vialii]|uniref:pentatricopeptide repeat-containing protein At3g24000, mitochondrial-like n=1 Tax=Rhododendron vialii TaxID=182163 RepID=UPI00265D70A8|nr:pentatricopeptide repeat-containing protein At3g24000, mitochondrial-like [Rhododendron vialii]